MKATVQSEYQLSKNSIDPDQIHVGLFATQTDSKYLSTESTFTLSSSGLANYDVCYQYNFVFSSASNTQQLMMMSLMAEVCLLSLQ